MDAFFSKSISLFSAFFLNLLPVGIGNIVGASLMTGFLLIIAKKN
jgi:formate/nitrite transporter FocA (FNT family)